LSLSSDRFIRFPPAPTAPLVSVGTGGSAGTADGFGEGRFGLRSEEEIVVSGGLRVYGSTL
jgi:hypothetical protein